ncbi:MAG: S4 domain-containing protein [Prevotella sp.]
MKEKKMRIDKYLKLTRLIKRRELAKQMLDAGFISINGKTAKPANEINIGDLILIKTLSGKKISVEVKKILNVATVKSASELYELKENGNE